VIINFFFQGIKPKRISTKRVKSLISKILDDYGTYITNINIIFTNDKYLLKINKKYLNHNFYTDIITFDISTENSKQTEIYISLDRAKENSKILNQKFSDEIIRLIIHGILHMIGFNDSTNKEKLLMSQKENYYLSYYNDSI